MNNKKPQKEKAGVVVYRYKDGEEPFVLVVSARRFKNPWVFPVGSVEKGEPLSACLKKIEDIEDLSFHTSHPMRLL